MSPAEEHGLPPPETLPDVPVVVVGNGASLLGAGNGAWIDGHDVVVRFNLFQTGRFAADVGSKTTIWFNNRDATSATVRKILGQYSFARIYVHTWSHVAQAVATFEQELAREARAIPVSAVERGVLTAMRHFLGGNYSMFSTGAIGTWIMLQQYRQVTLAGFDWWDAPARHHYGNAEKFTHDPARGHQPDLEREFFQKLAAEGRLKWRAPVAPGGLAES